MITESDLVIEGKGKDRITCPNMLHILSAAEDDHWVVPAGKRERRYALFYTLNKYVGNRTYFDALYDQMENGGYAAMLYDLLHRDIRGWHPRYDIPQTDALLDQQQISLAFLDAWWVELLEVGVLPNSVVPNTVPSNDFDVVRTIGSFERLEKKKGLYTLARESSPRLKVESDHALGTFLRAKGCLSDKNVRTVNGHARGWKFPPLSEAREAWQEKIKNWKWRLELQAWAADDDHEIHPDDCPS